MSLSCCLLASKVHNYSYVETKLVIHNYSYVETKLVIHNYSYVELKLVIHNYSYVETKLVIMGRQLGILSFDANKPP